MRSGHESVEAGRAPIEPFGWLAAFAVIAVVALIAFGRQYFNINTETDFVGGFIPEAERFVRGERLEMHFHPPGLPLVMAALHEWIGNWLTVGLLLSGAGLVTAVASAYLFFRKLAGEAAGLGALLGIAASAPLLAFGAQATGDVLFLGLFYLSLLIAASAVQSGRPSTWIALGLVVGVTILMRTNGIVLLMLLLAPFIARGSLSAGMREASCAALGLMFPVGSWVAYATATGTPLGPTRNYANLALTYYAVDNRIGGEERLAFERQFSSSLEVLLHDPAKVLQIYVRDFLRLPGNILREVTYRPLALLGAIGALGWLWRWRDVRALMLLGVIAASILLINMKAFEPRYYFFLAPFLGASAAMLAGAVLARWGGPGKRELWLVLPLLAFVLGALGMNFARARDAAEDPAMRAETREGAAATRGASPASATVISRKPVVPFYADRGWEYFPDGESMDLLCATAARLAASGHEPYVFVGRVERNKRPAFARVLESSRPPAGYEKIASGPGGGGWTLLRVRPAECVTPSGPPAPGR